MPQLTANQLKDIAGLYNSLITDASACVGVFEIQNWIETVDRVIDQNTHLLDAGVSKQNAKNMARVSEAYHRLDAMTQQMRARLIREIEKEQERKAKLEALLQNWDDEPNQQVIQVEKVVNFQYYAARKQANQ